jgi:ribonucleoside-diphosphate reductase alpha chain
VPLQTLVDKFSHTRYEPSGFTANPEIPIAKSITDYIFRWLASKFLGPEERAAAGVISRDGSTEAPALEASELPALPQGAAFLYQQDAPSCSDCGAIMVRNGACYKCLNCGSTSGCS